MVNTKPNSGSFKKGCIPWNKGVKKELDLELIKKRYFKEKKSTDDIGEEFGVSGVTIGSRLKENGYVLRNRYEPTDITKEKIRKTNIKKGIKPPIVYGRTPWNKNKKGLQVAWNKGLIGVQKSTKRGKTFEELYGKDVAREIKKKIKERRAKQIFPLKDSLIEVKIQNFLKKLGIEFFTHQHINIKHSYQCDIFVPLMNLVIECDGDYWHKYPIGRDIDHIRTSELLSKGFRVLRLWEFEIKDMNLNDFQEKIK